MCPSLAMGENSSGIFSPPRKNDLQEISFLSFFPWAGKCLFPRALCQCSPECHFAFGINRTLLLRVSLVFIANHATLHRGMLRIVTQVTDQGCQD